MKKLAIVFAGLIVMMPFLLGDIRCKSVLFITMISKNIHKCYDLPIYRVVLK